MPETEEPVQKNNPNYNDTVFHYSREHRLNRASADVRSLNEGSYGRTNVFKTLFAARGNRFVLAAVVLLIAFGLSRFTKDGQQGQSVKLGGNTVIAAIFPLEETLILGLLKSAPESGELYTGAVDIVVRPSGNKSRSNDAASGSEGILSEFTHRVYFTLVDSESFQISLPFEGTDFFVMLQTGQEQRTIRLKVTKQ